MFLVETVVPLHLCPIPLGHVVFYVATNVSAAGVEVVTQVVWWLIHFLLVITVVALASLRAWRASIITGVSFIIAGMVHHPDVEGVHCPDAGP
jgi:cell division protein FtsW (lipid II flippase)